MRYWNNKHKPKDTGYLGQKKAYKIKKIPYLSGPVHDRQTQIAWFLYDFVDSYLVSRIQSNMILALPSSMGDRFCNVWGTNEPLMSAEVN